VAVRDVDELGGFGRGDSVRIRGERGTYKVHRCCVPETGEPWCVVYGGAPGHGKWRDVAPRRLVLLKRASQKLPL